MIAIFCKHCKNIIYSRAHHDYHSCDCERCSVDGGFEYTRLIGNEEDYIVLELKKDKLLEFILNCDWRFKNINAKDFPNGYFGKFKIGENSNPAFYKKLIVAFEKIRSEFTYEYFV
jgi:hypothetical protein